jgi:hypothetical protein
VSRSTEEKRGKMSYETEPLYRKFHRACLAICVVLAPVVLYLGFALDPTGGVGVPSNHPHILPSSASVLAANFQAASPLQTQLFLYFNAVTIYFFPLSFIGLGLLALRSSPWLATLGMIFGLVGSLPFAVFVGLEALGAALGQFGASPSNAVMSQYVFSQGAVVLLAGSWVIGHLIGYVIMGIALIRSQAIPRWAALLFIVGIPFQAAGYSMHVSILQLICFALIFLGSIPAALAILKLRDEQAHALVPTVEERTPTS